ncbi:MAG: DUF4261 domain-containing protein [Anaerolineae bacterium]|nr:DUF4261 domain-containing protein [Anaerolineae bacterium]
MLGLFRRRKPSNAVALAMVALSEPRLPTPEALQAYLSDNLGLAVRVEAARAGDGGLSSLALDMGSSRGFVGLMPVPIPWPELEGPCATAWWWPEATEVMRAHRAHAVVSVVGPGEDLIESFLVLTRLAAGVAATADCAGVYWGAGTVVHPAQGFVEKARQASRDDLPLMLWVDFRVQRTAPGTYRLFTTGLEALNEMEIEIGPVERKPQELLDLAYATAHYVLTSGATVCDGHTIGRSEAERVRIRFARSMWGGHGKVVRLEM